MQEQLGIIWQETLNIVKSELNKPTFKTWFEGTSPLTLENNTLVVSAPNSFAKEWLESRYLSLIKKALTEVVGEEVRVKFVPEEASKGGAVKGAAPQVSTAHKKEGGDLSSQKETSLQETSLYPKYTFDSFVIGGSNRFAHAAALAVAETPSRAYNPLFIYGGVGLGKTHLLQAIGHYIIVRHSPPLKVKYVSSEKFTNDFINSIRDKGKIAGFQKRYRDNDVLLVDDVQFLEGKEATQEEFFHTFNTLYQANKQIVITSDRPPKDMATLEDRLRSRFEWGLITDIQPPDLETRIAILRKKALADGLSAPDDVLELIASRIQSNIRELEGALIRVIAFTSLTKCQINKDVANEVLRDIFPSRRGKPISVSIIQGEVCKYFNISKDEIVSSKRSQPIVYPRQIAMYLARELTDLSLPKIGEEFGGRDHTTVIHARLKIERLLNKRREVYNQVQELTNIIKQKT